MDPSWGYTPKIFTAGNPRIGCFGSRSFSFSFISGVVVFGSFPGVRFLWVYIPPRYYTLGPFAHLDLELIEARRLIPSVSGVWELPSCVVKGVEMGAELRWLPCGSF